MHEERFSHIRLKFVGELVNISEKWAGMPLNDRMVEITCLFEEVRIAGFKKEHFLEEAAKLFDIGAQTAIRLWVDTLITHGPDFLKSPMKQDGINPDSDLPKAQQATQEEKPKSIPLEQPIDTDLGSLTIQMKPKGRGRKPNNPIENTEKPTVGSLLKARICGHFTKTEAEFAYKHIKNEWADLSHVERASVLRELLRSESKTPKNCDDAMEKLLKKIKFLSKEQLFGYLEVGQPDSLRHYANNNFLDDTSVAIIGSLRLELGDLFNIKELASELHNAVEIEDNLTGQGKFKAEVFQEIRLKLLKSVEDLPQLALGETYVINPDSPFADDYPGFFDDTFQLLAQDDIRHSEYKWMLKQSTLALFKGRGDLIFAIDRRAVCRPSEVKPKSDF